MERLRRLLVVQSIISAEMVLATLNALHGFWFLSPQVTTAIAFVHGLSLLAPKEVWGVMFILSGVTTLTLLLLRSNGLHRSLLPIRVGSLSVSWVLWTALLLVSVTIGSPATPSYLALAMCSAWVAGRALAEAT